MLKSMKLRNIKTSFILEGIVSTNLKGINYIFKPEGLQYLIIQHSWLMLLELKVLNSSNN